MSPPRPTSPAPAAPLARLLAIGALLGVGVLTFLDRGATRAYATPWRLLFDFVQLAPLAALALRAFASPTPLRLPARPWCLLAAASAATVLLAALVSPYRGPSLLAARLPLAGLAAFFLLHDWLAADRVARTDRLLRLAGWTLVALAVGSLGRWLALDLLPSGAYRDYSALIDHRNSLPLGHSNYTAGLALLLLPCAGALAVRRRGLARLGWSLGALLGLALLFSSGSRGGLIALAPLLFAALLQTRLRLRVLFPALLALAALTACLAVLHPRTRALLIARPAPAAAPNLSNVQRTAMLQAGLALGRDRPLLGWGPGTTPLAFPRYRARLDGGAENVLQLHSLPVQLWADLGLAGLLCALGFVFLVVRARLAPGVNGVAWVTLVGYGVFAFTDYQLDVPVFALALAACAALLAPPALAPARPRLVGAGAALALLLPLLGASDPTPRLNVRALALARDPAQADAAIALLRTSLARNPAQEIAHFNLGWILVTRDPAAAEKHFLAAAGLVPDKGGVYFGLALARLNQDHRAAAVRALALECLDDPAFLASPWWRVPALAALRPAATADLLHLLATARPRLTGRSAPYLLRELDYLAALAPWLDGQASLGPVLAAAHTPARVQYFAARPEPPDFSTGPVREFRRERTGYPVLMRDLDLPPVLDVFAVQETLLAADQLAFLFPPKGWLPSPLLLKFLAAP